MIRHEPPVSLRSVAGLIALCGCAAAGASEWTLVADQSSVTMHADKQGSAFSGVFESFTAEIDFDPAAPGGGRILGLVETGSIESGDEQNNTYVVAYLDAAQFLRDLPYRMGFSERGLRRFVFREQARPPVRPFHRGKLRECFDRMLGNPDSDGRER